MAMNELINDTLRKLANNYFGESETTGQKLLVSDEQANKHDDESHQLSPIDDGGLIGRAISRISHQEIQNQKNIEDIIEMADQELANQPNDDHEDATEIDNDWFSHFSRYGMGVSSEVMKKGWAKILAREIRKPDSFSLRSLSVMSMLSRKEAEIIRTAAQYVVYTPDGKGAYLLSTPTMEGKGFNDILLLAELRLIDSSTEMALTLNRKDEEGFNFLLKNHDIGLFFSTKREQMSLRIYKITTIGIELLSLNDDVELDIDYVREYAEMMIKSDTTMSVTCSKILDLTESTVELDEEHPYFRIGAKKEESKES